MLRQLTNDPHLSSHLLNDHTQANVDQPTRGMLEFAAKLTVDPSSVQQADIQRLRDLGLSDEQVLAVALLTCLFAFMTRLADGLGVGVQDWLVGSAVRDRWGVGERDRGVRTTRQEGQQSP